MNSPIPVNQVFHGDCTCGMKQIPSGSVDLVITDPPFGIEFKAKKENYNRKGSRVLEGYNEIRENDYLTFTHNWMSEVKRVLKESGSMS
jgi:site-specific DNA-methyltransferase (adenine-specific)